MCYFFYLHFMEYIIALRHLGQLLAGNAQKYLAYLCTCNRTINN